MFNLKGFRTKIWAALASLPTAAATVVSQIDPQLLLDIVSQHPVSLACYQGVTYLMTHYYRDQAVVEPELDDAQIIAKAEKDLEKTLQPVDELELEMADDIGGDYEYVEPKEN